MSIEQGVNLLLVDDRPENLLALEAVLQDSAYTLVRAASGAEALQRLAEREFALILMDVQMPGMDGFETAWQIKRSPRHRDIPIIFITAISKDPVHVFRGYETGAIDYLTKPFDDHVLRAKVAVVVDLYRKNQQITRQERALVQANAELQKQIQERQHAEAALRLIHDELERRVRERTAALAQANEALQQEVNERRRIEQALRDSEDRFRILVHGVKDYAIVMLDPVGHIVSWNAGAERITGYQLDDILGKEWAIFYSREDADEGKPVRELQMTLAAGRLETEGWRIRKDGTRFWANVATTPLNDSTGRFCGFAKVICDVTDRRRDEQQLHAALGEKEVLLKEIHHRVKNNLQVISSLLSLQADQVRSAEIAGMFEQSQNRIRSMALVHEQLYGTKDLANIDMALYVRTLTQQLVSSSVKRGAIEVIPETDEVSLPIDSAIPCGLLLNELITNALKHAFPNGRRGVVRAQLRRQGPEMLCLTVQDNGVGLPASLDPARTESLGLRLVTALIDQLDAAMELDRAGGTKFVIRFRTPGARERRAMPEAATMVSA